MASRLGKVFVVGEKILVKSLCKRPGNVVMPTRSAAVYSESGAVCPRPEQTRFGLVKVAAMVFPFVYAGSMMSKNGAAFLEENDIFVPDDDDD